MSNIFANIIGGVFAGLIAIAVYCLFTGTGLDDLKAHAARLGLCKRPPQDRQYYRPARRNHAAA